MALNMSLIQNVYKLYYKPYDCSIMYIVTLIKYLVESLVLGEPLGFRPGRLGNINRHH